MNKKIRFIVTFLSFYLWGMSQTIDVESPRLNIQLAADSVMPVIAPVMDTIPESEIPEIIYSNVVKRYTIQDIRVTGIEDGFYQDFVLIGYSGLKVGDVVAIPGDEITDAVNRFLRQGLFADVKIAASRMVDDKVWLEIQLRPRPRISEIVYNGI
ncbi:MAG: outer membrane protein assembly factor BamA, partial [Tannerella sp.]|nr:outer membrane protein assembly factor BamA [Tannerella sp.]